MYLSANGPSTVIDIHSVPTGISYYPTKILFHMTTCAERHGFWTNLVHNKLM